MRASERKVRQYLTRSAGNCNHPSLHTIRCFVGMVQTGELTVKDFKRIGGEWLVDEMQRESERNQWGELKCY